MLTLKNIYWTTIAEQSLFECNVLTPQIAPESISDKVKSKFFLQRKAYFQPFRWYMLQDNQGQIQGV